MKNEKELINNKRNQKKNSDNLENWLLYSPIGREILSFERKFYAQAVKDIFGKYSVQTFFHKINLLQGNKIANYYNMTENIRSDFTNLPFKNDSIDLLICPHTLEFQDNYMDTLNEIYRVLAPNGKLIMTCFNKNSWLGLFCRRIKFMKQANLINLVRLKKEIVDIGFHIDGGKFFSYCPPFKKSSTLKKYNWLNKAGDRWFPTFANSFAIVARKTLITANMIDQNNSKNPLKKSLNTKVSPICSNN